MRFRRPLFSVTPEECDDELQRSLLLEGPLPTVHAGASRDVRRLHAVVLPPVQLALRGQDLLPRLRPAASTPCAQGGVGVCSKTT